MKNPILKYKAEKRFQYSLQSNNINKIIVSIDARRRLLLNFDLLEGVKAEIVPMLENTNFPYIAQNHLTTMMHFVSKC